jgi:hypothetical protein
MRACMTTVTRTNREFRVAGAFRLVTELCNILSPMVVRELILFVAGKGTTAVPPTT